MDFPVCKEWFAIITPLLVAEEEEEDGEVA